jgi:hypothetical protein
MRPLNGFMQLAAGAGALALMTVPGLAQPDAAAPEPDAP